MLDYVIVIPARYQSSRLPGKPLVDILGEPMIKRVFNRCLLAVPREKIYIATDDDRIKEVADGFGAQVVMTSSDCLTGTDRVAELAEIIDADYYINVQGDEPVFNPDDLSRVINLIDRYPGEIINGYCGINSREDFYSLSIPKVVFRPDGRLMYMSRFAIPGSKAGKFKRGYRQVCVYAFPKGPLLDFSSKRAKSPLEEIEDIEILRFLEMGYEVRMVELSSDSLAVDNPEDINKVVERLKRA